jgi:glycosyltransferase involved in cell wall biosynthesis
VKIVQLTTDNRQPRRQYDNPKPWFGTAPAALLQGLTQLPEVETHVVTCTQEAMQSSPEKLADNIWFHSLHVPKLGWMRTGYQGCIRAMRRKIREIGPDIVHGQGTERDCSLGAIFSGFPNVVTIHGNMRLVAQTQGARPLSFYWLAARLEAFTLPRTGGVICLSRHTERAVSALARKTWVLPNAVSPDFFDVSVRPDELPLILCVGSVCTWKNQNAFIRALDRVAAEGKLRVLFLGQAGDDAYGREFRELLATRPWCEYGGFADRAALKGWLGRATALALPSLEENCPMVVLEAMAAGVPVVAANVGGVPDLVQDEKTGLLFDPRDAAAMANAVSRLLKDAALARSLASDARRVAQETYHPSRIAHRHLEIYHEVLGVKPSVASPA